MAKKKNVQNKVLTPDEYKDMIRLYRNCKADYKFAIEHLFKVDTGNPQIGEVPFVLTPRQREVVDSIISRTGTLTTKPRQAGISTTTAATMACFLAFAPESKKERVLIMANKLEMATKMLVMIQSFLVQIPRWMFGDEYANDPDLTIFNKCNTKELELFNGSQVKAVAQTKDAARGYSPTFFIAEECAFWENGAESFIPAISSLAATRGTPILISTPNGQDPIYYETYNKAKTKENDYNIIEMHWYEDPRFNKDLKWVKENEDDIIETEFTYESYDIKIKKGYKPVSTWYLDMCKLFNQDKRRIAQELDVQFLGSGANFFDVECIQEHEKLYVCDPIKTCGPEKSIWIWVEPEEGENYILTSDVSTGDGEDFSTIQIINALSLDLVLEAKFKVKPDVLADYIIDYGLQYNAAYAVIERAGPGLTTILKLVEKEYPNIHYGQNDNDVLKGRMDYEKISKNNKIAGFSSTQNRTAILNIEEQMIRNHEFKIKSKRFVEETHTFIYRNGRPDHADGKHDDLILGLSMGLYIARNIYKEAIKKNKVTTALLTYYTNGFSEKYNPVENNINNEELIAKQAVVNSNNLWLIANKKVSNQKVKPFFNNNMYYNSFF